MKKNLQNVNKDVRILNDEFNNLDLKHTDLIKDLNKQLIENKKCETTKHDIKKKLDDKEKDTMDEKKSKISTN